MSQIIILSIFLPLLFQLTVGSYSLAKKDTINFYTIFTISIISHVTLSVSIFFYNVKIIEKQEIQCMNPMIGLVLFLLFLSIVLFLLFVIQFISKLHLDKKEKNVHSN